MFVAMAAQYDITIDALEVSPDQVHLWCALPPRYAMVPGVTRCKSVSARAICEACPRRKRRLWGGGFWEEGYGGRTVGAPVASEVIRRYIQQHRTEKAGDLQLKLVEGG